MILIYKQIIRVFVIDYFWKGKIVVLMKEFYI